jgi:hypothetical protein
MLFPNPLLYRIISLTRLWIHSKSQTYSVSGNKRRSSRDSGSLERGELRDARTEQPHEVIAMPSSNAKSREENAELYQEGSRYSQNYAPPTSSVGISQEVRRVS